ncbi:MAG: hypothetical protein K2H35_07275, partial [Muribaculaceae bacterium]|nr:hypothetical protein [Muribaculaceae bacterium]
VKGMGVRFNIRVEDYPLFRDVCASLLQDENSDKSLALISDADLKSLKLTGENKKRQYRDKGFSHDLAILGNAPQLKGDFSNIYNALERYDSRTNGKSFVEKFRDFLNLSNTEKIINLIQSGYRGIKTYPNTNRYIFYGSRGHWDYVFSSSDADFNKAFTDLMCDVKPSLAYTPQTLEYYICKYPQFISARVWDKTCGYYLYTEKYPFVTIAMTGRYSQRPLNGYNTCPYAYTVAALLSKEVKERLKISDWGFGAAQHGKLYIGDERYSLECRQEGWLWKNETNSQKWMKKWSARFEITSNGWIDSKGEFLFNGNTLIDLPGHDRIETAKAFINVLHELTF